ncbi:MAG: periplasmic heavy metal sensor [Candidatus Omnitrophota bacterium]
MKVQRNLAAAMVVMGIMVLATQAVCAQDRAPGKNCGGEDVRKNKERFFDELNITAQQKEQLKEIMQENRNKAITHREKLRTSRQALKEELEKVNSDTARINTLVAEVKNIEGQLIDERVNHILKIKAVLTPEQFVKFKEKMAAGRKKRMELMREKIKEYKHNRAKDFERSEVDSE